VTAHSFPSEAWATAYKDALNSSARYAEAAKDWTHGAVAMILKAEPAIGLPNDVGVLLDVHGGACRAATYMDAAQARDKAQFAIEGVYERWATMVKNGEDPIKTLMQGKLKLTKGHLPTIIRYVESSKQLLACARDVPTTYLK
jgi:putative sterol carrier protein